MLVMEATQLWLHVCACLLSSAVPLCLGRLASRWLMCHAFRLFLASQSSCFAPLLPSTPRVRAFSLSCPSPCQLIAITFASVYGIGVFACDLEGHGRSEGHPQCYFSSMDAIVADCHDYYCHVMGQKRFASLQGFVYGESLGASICELLSV